ncbi:probable LRR receptor-like serine/threonine-protein kinase At1g05700 [Nymphaea colorata]|nr:probable LRR receptor-like serine/threonine-protein kinase At1g05700 [Nymphaea colorata]
MASFPFLFGLCIAVQIISGFAGTMFLSIDCGGTANSTDELGTNWVVDDGYIMTGKSAKVQVTNTYAQEDQTLRYFPFQKKSCYVIPGVARGRKHMVRTSFFYGNYDGKSSPPSFDLQFDGNPWLTVETSSSESYYHEVIYAPKRDNISVCVAQTSPDRIPFISTLEIRELETGMYQTNSEEDVLLWRNRTAFGAKDFVRYPDDPYDRYWHPGAIDGTISVTIGDNTSSIQNSRDIPGKALVHAITPASSNATTLIVTPSSDISLDNAAYYYIFYFSEVSQAASQKKSRSFDFLVDGIKRNNDPIIPPYWSYVTDYNHGRNLTAGSVISLVNTLDASLPPILNAMELFKLKTGLADGTSRSDVNTLQVLQGQYQHLQSWAGDPCLPAGSTWDWLNCNTDDLPRITELHLSGSGLNGALPDFSGLSALEIIDLSNNSLNGQIPEFLGRFPSLKELNLAENNFTGPLPTSLAGNKKLRINTKGNNISDDNPSPPPGHGERNMKPIIVGVSVGSVILFLLLVGCVIYARLRSQHPRPSVFEDNVENQVKQPAGSIQLGPNHAFTYEEIVKITRNFEILIGNGGSGSVYYGRLKNSNEVAVKVLKDFQQRGSKEFVVEVKLLMTVHHKNLVSFVGFCDEGTNMIVLYEYMHNGSLRDILSGKRTAAEPLTWKRRLQIALDVAMGLDYLHSGCQPAIIHRDIKSTNILLNERLEAKVADFGISKAVERTQISTMIVGTPGYIDPEYSEISILTKKSDVYSFGVVLFELMSGQGAIFSHPEQHFHIVEWATSKIVRGNIENIIDPRIKEQQMSSMWKVADIAIACTARRSIDRPNMYNILKDLNEAMEMVTGYQALDVSVTEVMTTSAYSPETPIVCANRPKHPLAR